MKTVPLRYLAEINPQTPQFDAVPDDALVTFLPLETVWSDGRADQTRTAAKSAVASGYTRFQPGDVVCPKVTPTFQAGRSMIAKATGAGTTELHILRPRQDVDPRWVCYAVRSKHFLDEGVTAFQGVAGLQRVPPEFVASFRVADVGPDQQRRIADFLDDRVARIDKIITARRAQAQLLRERFNTLRHAAVRGTGGDTITVGTWIGRVNSRWDVRRMGSLAQFYAGAGFPHESQGSTSGDLPFAKVSDMQSADSLRTLSDANNWISLAQARQLGAQPAPQGTIIFPKVGAALLTNNRAVLARPMAFDNNVMGVLFPTLPSRYWFHVLSVIDMGRLSNPGPVPSINREAVAELRVPFPKVDEQDTIGRTLDEAMLQVEQQVQGLGDSIRLMTEFKQSLITAAVSGELDVSTANSEIPG